MPSMKDLGEELGDTDVEDIDMDSNPTPGGQETPENTQVNRGESAFTKLKDVLLSDTSHKDLEEYNPEDYSLPNTKSSKRLIRATDVLLKDNLETVISDYIFGVYKLVKDKSAQGAAGEVTGEAGKEVVTG